MIHFSLILHRIRFPAREGDLAEVSHVIVQRWSEDVRVVLSVGKRQGDLRWTLGLRHPRDAFNLP